MSTKLTDDNVKSRFFSKYSVTDDCWIWNAALNSHGYGILRVDGKTVLATHISLAIFKSEYKQYDYQCALHSCDNTKCVNPSHLRWGTQKENAKDRLDRNRQSKMYGESNGRSKLTSGDVAKIKSLRASNVKARDLANYYNVNISTIYRILSQKLWSQE